MTRHSGTRPLGDGGVLHRVVWHDDRSEGMDKIVRRTQFLRELLDGQDSLGCGPGGFETMRMHHTGDHWVVELEAKETRG